MTCPALKYCLAAALSAAPSLAPLPAAEANALLGSSTNLLIVSNAELRRGWRREHVMESGTNLVDSSGTIASKADGAAVAAVAGSAGEIADSAKSAMESAVGGLEAVTNQVPSRAQHVVLSIRPDLASRAALTFILTNATVSADGRTLSFTAACNRLLSSKPSLTLSFGDGIDADADAKVTWTGDWDAESATHAGTAEIPAKYRGRPACLFRNVSLGDSGGLFDFGGMVVTVGGRAAWNGVVTNALDGAEVRVKNGFFMK